MKKLSDSIKRHYFGVAFIFAFAVVLILVGILPGDDTQDIHVLRANITFNEDVEQTLDLLRNSLSEKEALEAVLEMQEKARLKKQRKADFDKWPKEELMRYAMEHADEHYGE